MKIRYIILVLLCFLIYGIFGQSDYGIPEVDPKEFEHYVNSAPPADDSVLYNVDVLDTLNSTEDILPLTYSKVFTSVDNQSSWNTDNLSLIGGPGYENTYSGTFSPLSSSGDGYYYFQVKTDSTVTSMAPLNSSETFPTPI